jgi:hypothetical protein
MPAFIPHWEQRSRGARVTGRPALLIAWIECEACGRIDKASYDFSGTRSGERLRVIVRGILAQHGCESDLGVVAQRKPPSPLSAGNE